MQVRQDRPAASAVAAVALLCALGGCSTGSPGTQSSPAATPAVATSAGSTTTTPAAEACTDVVALKSSLETLTKVKPAEDGIPALKTAIADVKTKLVPARASASEALQPGLDGVETAFAELQTAADGLTADTLPQKGPSIRDATEQLRTATSDLSATLTQGCPGG